ncbi:MAG: hypothetical protein Q8O30_12365 [Candidatus Omnitrophota bacterium]|nr:hypothetical protein [Candidatus Omnitrophota bacterium]
MIKKVIITGLIVCGIFIVYQKFIAPNSKSFLNRQSTIDFMGTSTPGVNKITKNK